MRLVVGVWGWGVVERIWVEKVRRLVREERVVLRFRGGGGGSNGGGCCCGGGESGGGSCDGGGNCAGGGFMVG